MTARAGVVTRSSRLSRRSHATRPARLDPPEPGEPMFRRAALAVIFSASMFGCTSNTDDTQEIVDNLIQAGFRADDIMVVNGVVYTGRDAAVTLEASREMLASDPGKEQYRTTNLVSQTLTTICVNGSKLNKEPFNTALNNALANYNNLNLTFHMLRTSGNQAGCD